MPVTAMITWDALSGSDKTGISDGCDDTVEYNLTICDMEDTIVHQMTYSDAMATVYNLKDIYFRIKLFKRYFSSMAYHRNRLLLIPSVLQVYHQLPYL